MNDKKMRELLEQLNDEIGNTKNVDEKGKDLLIRTRTDIENLLDQQKNETHVSTTNTASRLEEAIVYMEATHPQLTMIMTDLLDILSNAGI